MNTSLATSTGQLSNDELLARIKQLASAERDVTVTLIAHLAELDKRRLYLGEGYSSLFVYCRQVLHLSEHAAYGRIAAARASRRFPVILEMLASGAVNLTTVVLLARHLTPENHREVLDSASYKSKRQIQEIVAGLCPQPPVPALVRRLPNRRQVFAASASSQETVTETPLTGESSLMADHASATAHIVVTSFGTDAVKRAVVEPLAPERYKIHL